jgi:uncharacterized membrane protein YkvA (DUF1232 family)
MADDSHLSLGWIVIIALIVVVLLAIFVGAVILLIRLLRMRKLLNELGASGKFAFYGALIYTIFPIDLLPDPIYLDDMGVLTGALIYLSKLAAKRRETNDRWLYAQRRGG